jgi:aminopeptidase N
VIGTRTLIKNDRPVIGAYGVNDEGSGDKYYKGGNMLHTIRQLVNDDEKWRRTLRGLNATFRHQTVTTAQIETYMADLTGVPLAKVFDQYLRTTLIPALELKVADGSLSYRWMNVVPGFTMPIRVTLPGRGSVLLRPTEEWKTEATRASSPDQVVVDDNYYVIVKRG